MTSFFFVCVRGSMIDDESVEEGGGEWSASASMVADQTKDDADHDRVRRDRINGAISIIFVVIVAIETMKTTTTNDVVADDCGVPQVPRWIPLLLPLLLFVMMIMSC